MVLLRSGVLRAGMRWWRDRQPAISRGVAVAVVTCSTHCGYGATGSGSRSWSQRVRDSAMNTWKAATMAFIWNKYYSHRKQSLLFSLCQKDKQPFKAPY